MRPTPALSKSQFAWSPRPGWDIAPVVSTPCCHRGATGIAYSIGSDLGFPRGNALSICAVSTSVN